MVPSRFIRIIVFCDESSLPPLRNLLNEHDCLFILAANRPKAIESAVNHRVPFIIQPKHADDSYSQFLDDLRSFNADLGICCSYGMKIHSDVLQIPRMGCVNFHGGILPYWRGANILNWAIIRGAKQTGVSAHYMTDSIDEGPVIEIRTVEIQFNDTARSLQQKIESITYPLVREVVDAFSNGRPPHANPQNKNEASYYPRRSPSDGRILWTMTNIEIHNLIRALVHPWPGAFINLPNNEVLVINTYKSLEEIADLRLRYQTSKT